MLKGRGSLHAPAKGSAGGNIVCPLHRWTYAPDRASCWARRTSPHDPCLNLNNYPLQEWNGLLFEDNGRDVAADLAGMGPRADLDFTGYVLDHVELHECNYNWKTFIEVYLEDYHVGPFHPGLGSFVTCDDLRWEFGPQYSVQTVGVTNWHAARPAARCTSAGTSAAAVPPAASRPSTARSGSPTTRTSWSSGTRMC